MSDDYTAQRYMVADDQSQPRSKQCGASLQFWSIPADFGQHVDITLQDTLHRNHTLRLFIDNQELGLQTQNNRTWLPAQPPFVPYLSTTHTKRWLCVCRGISPTSEMRAEIQMRSGRSFWTKIRRPSEPIDLQGLFNEYRSTIKHVFTVPSQS